MGAEKRRLIPDQGTRGSFWEQGQLSWDFKNRSKLASRGEGVGAGVQSTSRKESMGLLRDCKKFRVAGS